MRQDRASSRWTQLEGSRQGFVDRCERYAAYTLPKICLPDEYQQDNDELQHDFQSVGAQAVNHLTNKIMLAMFAPSRPFVRLDPGQKILDELARIQVSEDDVRTVLATTERKMVRELDKRALRPKLYEALKHLVVVGNVLLYFSKESMRVMGIKKFCVKRNVEGKVIEVIIKECVKFDELDVTVQEHLLSTDARYKDDVKVDLFKWLVLDGKRMRMTQWVDNTLLPKKFEGAWPVDQCPYKVLTWDLSDEADYGTGLVEDYAGDFGALSTLSEAQLNAAILASEFRWLVNPGGMTKVEDFRDSQNGSALPGMEGDVSLIQNGKVGELQVIQGISNDYINRIGRGFLLSSAVIRDAERVTAEEVRMQATELETSLGGAYSRLASDLQSPIANWLLKVINVDINGTDIEVTIITGLDALSRSGDLDNLRGFLQDMAAIAGLPEPVLMRVEIGNIIQRFAQGWGVDPQGLVKPEQQVQAEMQAMQQQAMQQQVQTAGGVAQAEAAAQQGME